MAAILEDISVSPLDMVMDILLTDPLAVTVIPFQLHLLWPVGCCDHFFFGELLGIGDAKWANILHNIFIWPIGCYDGHHLGWRT